MPDSTKLTVVRITGRDVPAVARLLEVLTRSNLLSPDVTWQEDDKGLLLHVSNTDNKARLTLQSKPGYKLV